MVSLSFDQVHRMNKPKNALRLYLKNHVLAKIFPKSRVLDNAGLSIWCIGWRSHRVGV